MARLRWAWAWADGAPRPTGTSPNWGAWKDRGFGSAAGARSLSEKIRGRWELPREVVIVGGRRTPFGRSQGQLRSFGGAESADFTSFSNSSARVLDPRGGGNFSIGLKRGKRPRRCDLVVFGRVSASLGSSGTPRGSTLDMTYGEKIELLKRLGYALIERQFRCENCTMFVKGGVSLERATENITGDIITNERRYFKSSVICSSGLAPGRLGECSSILTTIAMPTEIFSKSTSNWNNQSIEFDPTLESIRILHASDFSIHIHADNFPRDLFDPELPPDVFVIEGEFDRKSTFLQTVLNSLHVYAVETCVPEADASIQPSSRNLSPGFQRNSVKRNWMPSFSPIRFRTIQDIDTDDWLKKEKKALNDEKLRQYPEDDDSNIMRSTESTSRMRKWWKNPVQIPSDFISSRNEVDEDVQFFLDRFLPVHVMQIDTKEFADCNFQGNYTANDSGVIEIQLTHAQIVDFANTLDLFINHPWNDKAWKYDSPPLLKLPSRPTLCDSLKVISVLGSPPPLSSFSSSPA